MAGLDAPEVPSSSMILKLSFLRLGGGGGGGGGRADRFDSISPF